MVPTTSSDRILIVFFSAVRFSNANFLISRRIYILLPFIGIVSSRRFQQITLNWDLVEIQGNITENVLVSTSPLTLKKSPTRLINLVSGSSFWLHVY